MCLYIFKNTDTAIKIAEEDIPVHKLVNKYYSQDKFLSPCYTMIYQRNKRYVAKNESNDVELSYLKITPINGERIKSAIYEGLHSYLPYSYNDIKSSHVMYCYIPKGSEYAYDPVCDEYVSLHLVTTNKVVSRRKISYRCRIIINRIIDFLGRDIFDKEAVCV